MFDIQGILAIIGAIAFFAGLFGGFAIKDLQIPPLPKGLRFFTFVMGVVLISIAAWPFIRQEILVSSSSNTQQGENTTSSDKLSEEIPDSSDQTESHAQEISLEEQPSAPHTQNSPVIDPTAIIPPIQSEAIEIAIAKPIPMTPTTSRLANCGEFKPGEARKVSSGSFVIGDVVINGTPQYDSGGTAEGTVAYFEKDGDVYAEWGAGCYQGSIDFLEEIVQRELEYGCGLSEGCSTIRVVIVRSNGQQDVQMRQ